MSINIEHSKRPGFKSGMSFINERNDIYIPVVSRNINEDLQKRKGVVLSGPKPRLYGIKSKDQLSQDILDSQGIKVTLSDKTLTDLYGIKRPRTREVIDPVTGLKKTIIERDRFGNPVMDDRVINDTMLNSYKADYAANLDEILREVKRGNVRSVTDMNTINEFLAIAIVQDNITSEQLKKIYSIVSITSGMFGLPAISPVKLPGFEVKIGGKKKTIASTMREGVVTRDDLKDNKATGRTGMMADVFLYLISNAVSNGLTIERPYKSVDGNPKKLSTLQSSLSGTNVLDLKTAQLYDSLDSLAKALYKSSGSSISNRQLRERVIKIMKDNPGYETAIKRVAEDGVYDRDGWTNAVMVDGKFDPTERELIKETIANIFDIYASVGIAVPGLRTREDIIQKAVEDRKNDIIEIYATKDEKQITRALDDITLDIATKIANFPSFSREELPGLISTVSTVYVRNIYDTFIEDFKAIVKDILDNKVTSDEIKEVLGTVPPPAGEAQLDKKELLRNIDAILPAEVKKRGWPWPLTDKLKDDVADFISDDIDARLATGSGRRLRKGTRLRVVGQHPIDSKKRSSVRKAKAEMERYARRQTVFFDKGDRTIIK
jgi:hypothetical protein